VGAGEKPNTPSRELQSRAGRANRGRNARQVVEDA